MTGDTRLVIAWMSGDPATVGVEDDCNWAIRLMRAANVGRLPVLDETRLVGIVTEGDIHRRSPRDVPAAAIRVAGVMTYRPMTIEPTASVIDGARRMLELDVGALLVVEGSQLLGVFSRSDALAALLGMRAQAGRHV